MSNTNKDFNIKDLIDLSYKEQVWLPEFQRPFVWDKNQVRLLIDSLQRNYTISSILIWKGGDELARRAVGAKVKDIKIPEDKPEDVTYLLDGQQRTTALTLAFTDKNIYKGNNTRKKEKLNLYWDSEYDGVDSELKWIYDDEKLDNPDNPQQPIMLKEYTAQEMYKTFGHRFVKIKHAYNFDDNIVETWFDIEDQDEEIKMLRFKNEYNKKLKIIEKEILYRKVYEIEQKGTLEEVLEVFERINTKNTKLSIFDIMVAKTYRKFDEGFFDLRTYYTMMNYEGHLSNNYFDNIENLELSQVQPFVDNKDMLQLTTIILEKQFLGTAVLKLNTDLLMANTKLLHDKFHSLVQFMENNFSIESTELGRYNPLMKFLAGAISHFKSLNIREKEFLKSWFWNTLLKNRYPGAQSERIAKDYALLVDDKFDLERKLQRVINENTRSFNYLKDISSDNFKLFDAYYSNKSQQIYRALILLLKSNQAKDFYFGIQPNRGVAGKNKLEEHHIFPKKSVLGKNIVQQFENHKYEDVINNVANIALITKETNNNKIGSKLPSEYITDFENEYIEAGKRDVFIEIMASQFIDENMIELLKQDNFEAFIIERTKLLYNQVEKLCNSLSE
ncbi:DUF262 domain-containing protein [Croceibacter atlanticus]|uniref:GmrSD restriction endonuclease domain-containing protein n=1 Tax=Croceibacter atlanticus TaxID=313588 RepID=UPI002E12A17C|nr:DUF262 domain-containing protein [Croceibacter atlanticus]